VYDQNEMKISDTVGQKCYTLLLKILSITFVTYSHLSWCHFQMLWNILHWFIYWNTYI